MAAWCQERECEGLGVLEWDNELLPPEQRKAIQWVVSKDYSERFFYKQVLIGDSTDNIPGCPGIGPVKAAKIVDKYSTAELVECWPDIVDELQRRSERRKTYGRENLLKPRVLQRSRRG